MSGGKGAVGRSVPRLDAAVKVTGEAAYPADFRMEGMLHAAVVWSPRPHARLLGIDAGAALSFPGVVRVLTHRDVPVNEYGIIEADQRVLASEVVRWTGEPVAVVVAETEDAARAARDLVRVEHEAFPTLDDPAAAEAPGAPLVHPGLGTNVAFTCRIQRGDADRALREADVVVEAEYRTPHVEHAYLQPEAGLAYVDGDGRVTVIVAAQWPHDDVRQIAHALGLPRDRVREIVPHVGGAFGGREDVSLQILIALAAWRVRRPVRMVWSREESLRGHGKRHPFVMRCRWGARDGRISVAHAELVADAGAYLSTTKVVLRGAVTVAAGPYEIPNVRIEGRAVYTNNPPTMAMRGFGTAQPAVAYERQVDKLARALGVDPVEFRLKNLWDEGSVQACGSPLPPGVGVKETLRRAALAAGWRRGEGGAWLRPAGGGGEVAADGRRRGIGIATAYKNVGYSFGHADRSTARVHLQFEKGGVIARAELFVGASEVGMGVHTALAQIAADALGVGLDRVVVHPVDTDVTPDAGSSSASRHTFVTGNAVAGACRGALAEREVWLRKRAAGEGAREAGGVTATYTFDSSDVRPTTDLSKDTGSGNPHISYGYASQAAEVLVNPVTGGVELVRFVSAQDVGRAVNPAMIEGQVGGGLHMGAGYALMEEFSLDKGCVRTRNLGEYLVPTALDLPIEVSSIIVEAADPAGPGGAKGVGEMVTLPTAPAILNAVRDAVGIDLDELPARSERVWRALRGGGAR
jgi:CO/xanthine dehydrogenase Mo-binding subunit